MKTTCSQSELAAALSLVGRAVASRPSHPILANVLLTADAATGRLSVTGYDLSLGIHTSIAAAVETSGATTVPARLFGEIISRLPADGPITLSAASEQLEVSTLSGSYRVQQMPADDYPDLPLGQSGTPITLQAADLSRGLRATLFAASSDESKQLLTGVHLELASSTEFAATDGHRLAILTSKSDAAAPKAAITVPGRALRELERMLAGSAATVEMFTDKGQIMFSCNDSVLISRSLDGTYPNYRQLLPPTFSRCLTTNRKGLVSALERVAVVADQHNNVVKLTADPDRGEMVISADAQDVGSGSETVSAEITGDAIVIAFNARYLIDGLKAMAAEQVTLSANAPTTPAVLSGDEGYTYLVMPVQVKS